MKLTKILVAIIAPLITLAPQFTPIVASLLPFTSLKAEASPKAFDSIVASNPATSTILSEKLKQQSGLTPEQSRRMRAGSPYGYDIMTYWIDGDQYLNQGQFDNAIKQFQKAVDASKVFNRTKFTAQQNQRLKQCAIASSESSLKGAIAARDYYKKNSRRESALDDALAVYKQERERSFDRVAAKNPEFNPDSCP
jgi:tetratricopeptide (TPR) repeat protein